MKITFPIPLVVALVFATATRSVAVPPNPVNATSVTLLPADGTPEALRKMVAGFARKIADVNNDAGTKREQLRTQMTDGFERAIAAAQSAGDIDAILALKSVKEKFDVLTTSDIPMVKNAIDFRDKKTAEIEITRLADAMKAAKEFNDQLDKAKKDETTKGNFETAKAISDYQKKLTAWAQTLRATASAVQPARPTPTAVLRPQTQRMPHPVRQQPAPQIVSVNATRADGVSIGFAKAGDVFIIQYVGGRWMAKFEVDESPDASRVRWEDHRCVIVMKDNPGPCVARVPANTKNKPFSFTVREDGEYALRIWDGMDGWRREFFNDNRGTVRYSVQKVSSAEASANAPSTNPAASPFAVRQQEQFGFGEAKPGYSSATSINTAMSTRTIRVSGTDTKEGAFVGSFKEGDVVSIRYLDGKWRAMELSNTPLVSPDDDPLVHPGYQACVIVQKNQHGLFLGNWGRVPPGTAQEPYEFIIPSDGRYFLKIADSGRENDNAGSVRYEVKILKQGSR